MNTASPLVKILALFSCFRLGRRHFSGLLAIGGLSFASLGSTSAATYYWDINGAATGATSDVGGVASGTWDLVTANWTTNSAGTSATVTRNTTGDDVIFSAGTNATGASAINFTLGSGNGPASLTVEEGTLSFSGAALILRGNAKNTIVLGASAGGSLTFGNQVAVSGSTTSQTFVNQNTVAGRDIIFNNKVSNAGAGFTLTLSAASAGGITMNGILGEEFGTAANTAMAVIVNSAGTGATTLNAVNKYTGSTLVTAGTLVIGGSGSINNSSGVSVNGSTAVFRYGSSVALTRTLTYGASGGTFLYNSTAKYTGGSGSISVGTDDRIGGSGVLGHVTIATGGILTPGALGNGSAGQLTVDSLTLQTGAQSQFDISSAVLFDSIQSAGTQTLAGSFLLNFGSLLADGSILDLFTGAGSLTGNFDSITAAGSYAGSFALVGGVYQFDTGTQLLNFDHLSGVLSVNAIPEPSTTLLLTAGLMAILFLRRRS